MFDRAILLHESKIRQIIAKYMEYRPPSICKRDNQGPMPLCKYSFQYLIVEFSAMNPYYGLLIVFFGGMLCASIVFAWETVRRTKLSRNNVVESSEMVETVI